MPLTVAQAESIGVARAGPVMVAAQVATDPAADASPRAYMADPIRQALRDLGYPIADPSAPADGDLATIADDDENAILDVMELRVLESCAVAIQDVDFKADETSMSAGGFAERLETRIARLEKRCRIKYGVGASAVAMGSIGLDFAQPNPDTISWE